MGFADFRHRLLWQGNLLAALKSAAMASGNGSLDAAIRGLREGEKRRRAAAKRGVTVPAIMIISVTSACNLACSGCYAARCGAGSGGMTQQKLANLLAEASDLGVSIVMLAGGEPFLRPDLILAAAERPEMLTLVFTNGTLLNGETLEMLARNRHILPVFSLEGGKAGTDARRGAGVFKQVCSAMDDMRIRNLTFGVSITATAQNLDEITDSTFVSDLKASGVAAAFFVEYVPTDKNAPQKPLSSGQKQTLAARTLALTKSMRMLCAAFPGDESVYGGCLAAGRGFLHVAANGSVQPCPFAPFSDSNAFAGGLEAALASPLLAHIRDNCGEYKEGEGGCALWSNRDAILKEISE